MCDSAGISYQGRGTYGGSADAQHFCVAAKASAPSHLTFFIKDAAQKPRIRRRYGRRQAQPPSLLLPRSVLKLSLADISHTQHIKAQILGQHRLLVALLSMCWCAHAFPRVVMKQKRPENKPLQCTEQYQNCLNTCLRRKIIGGGQVGNSLLASLEPPLHLSHKIAIH